MSEQKEREMAAKWLKDKGETAAPLRGCWGILTVSLLAEYAAWRMAEAERLRVSDDDLGGVVITRRMTRAEAEAELDRYGWGKR